MTLIITAINKNRVVQVSDRRLTKNGKIYDSKANKAICVSNQDSQFLLAYTGFAEFILHNKKIRTDEYITNYLANINAGNLKLEEILKSLSSHLGSIISKQAYIKEQKRLTLVIGGFY